MPSWIGSSASLAWCLPYLTLPSGEDVLPPSTEASNGSNVHPWINHKVTKSPGVVLTWVHNNNGVIPLSNWEHPLGLTYYHTLSVSTSSANQPWSWWLTNPKPGTSRRPIPQVQYLPGSSPKLEPPLSEWGSPFAFTAMAWYLSPLASSWHQPSDGT